MGQTVLGLCQSVCRAWRLALPLALSLGLLTTGSAAAGAPLEYQLVYQWPSSDWPLDTLAGRPAGLAVARDGTVYLADGTVNRITVMDPAGNWVRSFGDTGSGPERLGRPERMEIDEDSGQIFVADTDSYRIVVYDLEGNYLEEWPDIYAADLSLAPDGRLWVADVFSNQIRAFTPDGQEVFSFGERGSGAGKFRQLSGISVAPSGDIYVGDRDGTRVQVFRPDPSGSTDTPLRLVRTMDLTDPKYQNAGGRPGRPGGPPHGPGAGRFSRRCSAYDVAAIDDQTLLLYPCLLKDGQVTFLTMARQSEGIFGFFSPYVDPVDGLFYSMALKIEGADDPRDPNAIRSPAVVRYADAEFRVISDVWALAPFDEDRFRWPGRVDVHPNGVVYVTEWRHVFRYSPEGEFQNRLPMQTYPTAPISVTLQFATGDGTPEGVIGLGICHSGANDQTCLGYFTITRRSWHGEPEDFLEPQWTTTMPKATSAPRGPGGRYATPVYELHYDPVNDLILVLDDEEQRLLAYPRLGRGRKQVWELGGTDRNALYADLSSGPDGLIYVLDVLRDEIQVRDATGDLLHRLPAPSDSWRIAGGPDGRLFVLTSFGEVVRLDARGREEARFDVRPNANAQPRNLSDLSVAADGRVFVADRRASLISVFAPTGGNAPVRAGETCVVRGDKTATPTQVPLGQEVMVRLSLDGSCGAVEVPTHILLVVNTKNSSAFDAARQVLALADFRRHRVGLLGYYVNTVFKVRWTQDASRLIAGLEELNAGGGSESSERNALSEAYRQLQLVEGRGVVVLIGAQYCVRAEHTECQEQHDAEEIAGRLRDAGYRVIVVNSSTDAGLLATSDLDVLRLRGGDLSAAVPVYQRVAAFFKPDYLLQTAGVSDIIPPNMDYVTGSASPPARWDPVGRTLSWDLAEVPYGGIELSYRLGPTEAGRWPTNVEAYADYTDGWNAGGRLTFPRPQIQVVAPPTPTPTATATALPSPTATSTPIPTPVPQARYLPLVFVSQCTLKRLPLDVALVLDISSSMAQPTRSGGPAKIEAARQAALEFLAQLERVDRVAVVAFDQAVQLELGLTGDLVAAQAAIAGLVTGRGTRIDLGLRAALTALESRRPEAVVALVLLTDGRPSTGPDQVLAAAAAARGSGVLVYAIGLGADVDGALLQDVAGAAERYFEAPRAEDLARIYGGLARELISCP